MKWILQEIAKRRDPLATLGRFLSMSHVLPGARAEEGGATLVLYLDRIRYEAPRETRLDSGARAWSYDRTRTRVVIGPVDPRGTGPTIEQVASLAGHLLFGIRVTSDGAIELRTSRGVARTTVLPLTRIVIEDIGGEDRETVEVYVFGPAPWTDMAGDVQTLASA